MDLGILDIFKMSIHLIQTYDLALQFSSVQFSRSVVSDSLRSHELQHARPPCESIQFYLYFRTKVETSLI